MTIPLPPLPDDFQFKGPRKITANELRAIQREAMRAALIAAAELCRNAELKLWEIYKRGDADDKQRGRGSDYVQGASDQSGLLCETIGKLEIEP